MRIRFPLAALSAAVAAVLSSGAEAVCARWDLSGDWGAVQSNGFQPRFVLRQTPNGFQGDVAYVMSGGVTTYLLVIQKGNPAKIIRGTAQGAVSGNSIEITVQWNNGSVGVYTATINDFGRMQGVTFDQQNPKSTATWVGDRNLNCAGTPSQPASAPSPASDRCPSGRVWRNVTEADHVCVAPAVRAQVRTDNNLAAQRRTGPPVRRAVCPSTGSCLRYDIPCKPGFVWRAAVSGDFVCVTQVTYEQTQRDNLADQQQKIQRMMRK